MSEARTTTATTAGKKKRNEEERLLEYKRVKKINEKKKREERKREVEEGRTGERRLAFLMDIAESMGYTQKTLALASGLDQQLVSWYFSVSDDCKLSRAQSMLAGIGLELKVRLEKKKEQAKQIKKTGRSGNATYRIEGDLSGIEIQKELPEYVRNCTPDNRLYFLREFIENTGQGLFSFAKLCGMDATLFRYYFGKDDMKISVIYGIAESNGAEIVWSINALKNEDAEESPQK